MLHFFFFMVYIAYSIVVFFFFFFFIYGLLFFGFSIASSSLSLHKWISCFLPGCVTSYVKDRLNSCAFIVFYLFYYYNLDNFWCSNKLSSELRVKLLFLVWSSFSSNIYLWCSAHVCVEIFRVKGSLAPDYPLAIYRSIN